MLGSTAPERVSRGDNSDLSAHIAACLHELVDQGYAKLTIDMYRGSLGHFSYWVTRDKIKWRGHEEASIRRFLTTHLPSCDCIGRHQHDRSNLSAALLHLLRFLRTHRHTAAHTPDMRRTRLKRKCNDLMPIWIKFVASRRRPVVCEGITFADSCPHTLCAVPSS